MTSRPGLQVALSSPAATHRSQQPPLQATGGADAGPPAQSPLLPSSLSDLAAVGLGLPRNDDRDDRRLADQNSHLTLPMLPGDRLRSSRQASSASGPGGAVPEASRGHSQLFSTLPAASEGPLPPQHVRQSAPSVHPPPSTVVAWHPAGDDAQPAPPISRGQARMRDDGQVADEEEEVGRHRMQAADAAITTTTTTSWLITDVVPGWTYEYTWAPRGGNAMLGLADLPNELLLHILSFLDVSDLLAISRTSHHFRSLALAPTIHRHRLRHARAVLPPLLTSPSRPSLSDLMARSIFLTNTTVVSRKLARSLTAIRLSRRLAARPPPEVLVARSVLPPECVPGQARGLAPALVAKTRAVERERVKDGLRRWVGSVWERRWREKAEDRRRWEERSGVGRVWRLRRFWERVGRGEVEAR